MKLRLSFIGFLSFFWLSHAQKIIDKQFLADKIKTVVIEGNNMFKITVNTAEITEILIALKIEGEHSEQIILLTEQIEDSLKIASTYQPLFNKPDDKLSAHKKISIELTVSIPEGFDVTIKSDIASVFVEGLYNNLVAELLNGHFITNNFTGNLLVNTIHGNISVVSNFAKHDVYSKNGTIKKSWIDSGSNQISLNSINGNITLSKTK